MALPPLDQLKKLREEITPGPWGASTHLESDCTAYEIGPLRVDEDVCEIVAQTSADIEAAALAPDLLAEAIRLREALAEWREEEHPEVARIITQILEDN